MTTIVDEAVTIDWDALERDLAAGEFRTKEEVTRWCNEHAGRKITRSEKDAVIAGLFAEYRKIYDALPAGGGHSEKCALLNWDLVRSIRARHLAGETVSAIARSLQLGRSTISNVVNHVTWREN